ncbi:helix-turn-helix transcriptional regulator [[Kitasatospora] papulosa]|uniref:helix-turn-helix transcriptional regulator n=1 Tax=[Kitasatospora] papulosa TaxID=1464011 RepID=UPI00368C4339
MSSRPMLTQREAAAACGVSRTTIRRRREAGDLPGAVQDPVRGWVIPVDDLLAAGLRLHAPSPPDEVVLANVQERPVAEEQGAAALRAELERVRHEHALAVAEAEHGRLLAQAEAQHLREQLAARGEHIADLQRALKALMPAPERPVLGQPSVPGQAQPETESAEALEDRSAGGRRRWWKR